MKKLHPYQPKIKCRPMSRRLAYKVYNNILFWGSILELKDRGDVDLTNYEAIAKALNCTERELRRNIRRYRPLYSPEQIARARVKVNRDIYHKDRRVKDWTRYKIGKDWRNRPMNPEIAVAMQAYSQIAEQLAEIEAKFIEMKAG